MSQVPSIYVYVMILPGYDTLLRQFCAAEGPLHRLLTTFAVELQRFTQLC